MDIELYFTVMAGMVLAFFLMVGELVALRKVGMRLFRACKTCAAPAGSSGSMPKRGSFPCSSWSSLSSSAGW